jgi:hypothetical protein
VPPVVASRPRLLSRARKGRETHTQPTLGMCTGDDMRRKLTALIVRSPKQSLEALGWN